MSARDELREHQTRPASRNGTGAAPVFPLTDLGNAERLVAMNGEDIRYVPGNGWYEWDGKRWARDHTGALLRLAKQTARAIYHDAANCEADDERKRILAWARASESEPRLRAMVSLAESERQVIALAEQLDAEPGLLTVRNGTIDLKTGKLRAHDRADLITKLAGAEYDPDGRSALWERFLTTTTDGDDQLAAFLQRCAGYSLTGDVSEEVLFFAHGPAATGKSTFLEAIKVALGKHATTADFETFLKRRGDSGIRNDVAQLAGARMVISVEVDDGKALAEGLISILTGGDTVRTRFLYRESFEFQPRFKLWLAANCRPRVRADDSGMWRRIVQIPFTHTVPEDKRDHTLKTQFRNDPEIKTAVLAWAVRGCLEWQAHGLKIPERVRNYTAEYRAENDPLAEWIADECLLDPTKWTASQALRGAYERWSAATSTKPIDSGRTWGNALKAHGCERKRGTDGKHGWSGIELTNDRNDPK